MRSHFGNGLGNDGGKSADKPLAISGSGPYFLAKAFANAPHSL
jgi:hypothetical protein